MTLASPSRLKSAPSSVEPNSDYLRRRPPLIVDAAIANMADPSARHEQRRQRPMLST